MTLFIKIILLCNLLFSLFIATLLPWCQKSRFGRIFNGWAWPTVRALNRVPCCGTLDDSNVKINLLWTLLIMKYLHAFAIFFFLETEFCYIAQTGVECLVLLPQPPECRNYRPVPPCAAHRQYFHWGTLVSRVAGLTGKTSIHYDFLLNAIHSLMLINRSQMYPVPQKWWKRKDLYLQSTFWASSSFLNLLVCSSQPLISTCSSPPQGWRCSLLLHWEAAETLPSPLRSAAKCLTTGAPEKRGSPDLRYLWWKLSQHDNFTLPARYH